MTTIVTVALSEPAPGWNVVWAEGWDEEEDSPRGMCHDCGHATTPNEAAQLLGEARAAALAGGWPGRAWVTDGMGRRAGWWLARLAAQN